MYSRKEKIWTVVAMKTKISNFGKTAARKDLWLRFLNTHLLSFVLCFHPGGGGGKGGGGVGGEEEGGGAGGGRRGSFAKKLAIAGLVGVGSAAVGVIAAPAIATAALGAAGFTASGVAAGSAAAAVQSTVFGGYVASGSLFALCQSAGATGAISAATSGLIGGTTGLAGAGTTWGISKFFVRFCHVFYIVSDRRKSIVIYLQIVYSKH